MVLGGSLFSVIYDSKGLGNKDNEYIRFAKDILTKLTINIYVGFGLCIIPLLTITFIYAQLLYGADIISINFLAISVILYIIGLILINVYKKIIAKEDTEIPNKLSKRSIGWLGTLLLFVATFFYVASVTMASNLQNWPFIESIIGFLISKQVWLNFLYFISASFALSGAAVLYFFLFWQGGIEEMDEKYSGFVKKFGVGLALISSIVQLFILFLSLTALPRDAFTGSIFLYSTLAIVSIFFTTIFLYAILKNAEIKYAGAVFFLVFLTFTFTIIKDHFAFANTNKERLLVVNLKAEELIKEKYPQLEKKEVAGVVNAEEIFNTRCIACHKYDEKHVGPPYNETIPKYEGDVDKLSKFILNPVKINPEYPDMPNQGLKKEEADALAKFLIEKVQKK
jgi:cytochrome c